MHFFERSRDQNLRLILARSSADDSRIGYEKIVYERCPTFSCCRKLFGENHLKDDMQ